MKYDPSLSVEENAKENGCSVANVRLYIKLMNISRSTDRTRNIIEDCRRVIENDDSVTDEEGNVIWANLHKATGYSLKTLRKHREKILSNGMILPDDDSEIVNLLRIPEEAFYGSDKVDFFGTIGVGGTAYNVSSVCDVLGILRRYGVLSRKNEDNTGIVYFGKSDAVKGAVKIGSTHNRLKAKRNNQLLTSFPGFHMIRTIDCNSREDAARLETELHDRFKEYRIDGEWFNIPSELLNIVYEEYGAKPVTVDQSQS